MGDSGSFLIDESVLLGSLALGTLFGASSSVSMSVSIRHHVGMKRELTCSWGLAEVGVDGGGSIGSSRLCRSCRLSCIISSHVCSGSGSHFFPLLYISFFRTYFPSASFSLSSLSTSDWTKEICEWEEAVFSRAMMSISTNTDETVLWGRVLFPVDGGRHEGRDAFSCQHRVYSILIQRLFAFCFRS